MQGQAELVAVGPDHRQLRRQVERQLELLLGRLRPVVGLELGEDLVQAHIVLLQRERAGLDLGDREDVADDPVQPEHLLVDDVQAVAHDRGIVLALVERHLGVEPDVRERRAQLVRGLRHEGVPRLLGHALLRDVLDNDHGRADVLAPDGPHDEPEERGRLAVAPLDLDDHAAGHRAGG